MRNIAINDTVRIGPTGPELVVADIQASTETWTIYVWYDLTNNTSVPIRTRLYLVGKPAAVYSDPYARTAASSSLPTDSNGRVGFYVADERFDYLISSSDFTTRGFTDAEGGWKASDVGWVNAKDFPTIQDAVNAAAWGGVVYIPMGQYNERTIPSFTQTLVLPADRPVRLVGDGPGLTVLRAAFAYDPGFDPNKDFIQLTGDNQSVEDLSLEGGLQSGQGVGIRITRPGTTDQVIYGTLIRNVRIHSMPYWGIFVGDPDSDPPDPNAPIKFAVWSMYENVEIESGGGGYAARSVTTTQFFKHCNIKRVSPCVEIKPSPRPGYAGAMGLSFVDCIFDNTSLPIRLTDASNVSFLNCWFEGTPYSAVGAMIEATGSYEGLSIIGCRFVQILDSSTPESRNMYAIRVAGVGRSVLISNIVVVLGTNTAPDDPPPPYHIVIEPPEPGGPASEVVILGGSLRDISGLEDETHRTLRILAGSPKTTLIGTMWRSRLAQLGVSERNLLRQPSAGDLIYNSQLNRLEYFNGTEWRYVENGPVP